MDWTEAWSAVCNDPDNFEKWQDLVEVAEGLDGGLNRTTDDETIELFRFTFDRFLEKFPMLQGFWARYAAWEFKLGNNKQALRVYERAVSFMPGCVDLWTRYCDYKALITNDPDTVRRLFERAVEAIGHHFLSHEFWDCYVKYERKVGTLEQVLHVLSTVITIPIHQYARFYDEFRKVSRQLAPEKTAPQWKIDQFRAEYELEREEGATNENISRDYDLRVRINYYYDQIYEQAQWTVSRLWQFEQNIKRHHFELTYLEEAQLVNWKQYLHFSKLENPSVDSQVLLYERAVIPNALNEEIWLNYVRYLLSVDKSEHARNVMTRACVVLPIGRVQLRHFYARYLESQGEIDSAKTVYETILENVPGSLETIVLLAGLALRHEGYDEASNIYSTNIQLFSGEEAGFLVTELASMTTRVKDASAGREIYTLYEPTMASSFIFWREYLKFEIANLDHDRICYVFEEIKNGQLHSRQIKDLGHYYMEYSLTHLDKPHEFLRADAALHKSASLTL